MNLPLQQYQEQKESERLRKLLLEAVDYLDRLPRVPVTYQLAKRLRSEAAVRTIEPVSGPAWTGVHELYCYDPAGIPTGIKLEEQNHNCLRLSVIENIIGSEGVTNRVRGFHIADKAKLDGLIDYLCIARANLF